MHKSKLKVDLLIFSILELTFCKRSHILVLSYVFFLHLLVLILRFKKSRIIGKPS